MNNSNIIATIILLLLDFLWLGLYMNKQYQKQVQKIQESKLDPKPIFAVFSYILMIVGLNLFVLPRIRKGHELEDSFKYGFTFGIVLYGVYDFTSATVLKDWNMKLAIIDILWGGFVFFIATYIGSLFK